MLVVGAFFVIGGGQELAADDNADAIIRDGIIHSASGGNFADFRHQYQSRLLFALDGVLARQAENALTDNFAAVKKADVQLQTPLGNRKGQIGMNIIGAFAESQNSAFGWQVRAFGAENDTKGANAGIFFRRLDGESLYGINSFADYEDGKYGEFLRYGIGGELQNRFAAFAINYYLPITDDKGRGATVAFSQKGYDANLRISIPQLDFLKVRADYYLFDGKYGGEDDKGFRYGLEVQPISNLRIGAFYDDGGEKFGGDIAYIYNFGIPQKRESAVAFSPDLFSPVLREYSQRIVSTTTLRIEVLRTPTLTSFITTTIPVMTITNIIGDFVSLTTFMTAAGLTLTTAMTTMMTVATREASVQIIAGFSTGGGAADIVVSTRQRYLMTLPPLPASPPIVLTINRNLRGDSVNAIVISTSNRLLAALGTDANFPNSAQDYTIMIVEGSEQFISITTLVSTTTEMQTSPPITTETRMTNAGTRATMEVITPERMITTAMTAFLIRTITLGLPTTTIGAAKVDSHLPPSFPPLSFPPLSPIMVSYGLAKNGDSWIPAAVIPAFAPFPRHFRAGGNQLAAGRRILMAQSAI